METLPLLKNPVAGGRRDEWSEGAVASLLDAYESKWELRSRAKLKGRDWDDVARRVSGRAGGARPAKTPSQCKNKIESMKKRYRSESAATVAGGRGLGFSRWPFFGRIQRLMNWKNDSGGVFMLEASPAAAVAVAVAEVPIGGAAEMNGGVGAGKESLEGKGENKEQSQAQIDAEHSKPTNDVYKEREDKEEEKEKKKKKRRMQEREEEGDDFDVIESIQSLAETALKVEQLRMEAMRDVEKIWAQAEAKKGELDLKRTEITAKTQLKIARLFCKSTG